MRCVTPEGMVRVLNTNWTVPQFDPTKGVWVTVEFKTKGAILSIFDEAPDAGQRRCLATYPFPLKEPVFPKETIEVIGDEAVLEQQPIIIQSIGFPTKPSPPEPISPLHQIVEVGEWLLFSSISRTTRLAQQVIFTMY